MLADPPPYNQPLLWTGPRRGKMFLVVRVVVTSVALPVEKQRVEEVERQIRRIVERALGNLREDSASFVLGGLPGL